MPLLVIEKLMTSNFLLLDNLFSLARGRHKVKQKPEDTNNYNKSAVNSP